MELAAGATFVAAAERAGMSTRTARRRAQDPDFIRHVRQWRDAMVDEAVGQLVGVLDDAIGTLRSLLDADSETVRLRAASLLIDQTLKLREHEEIQYRLALVEEAQQTQGDSDWQAIGWD